MQILIIVTLWIWALVLVFGLLLSVYLLGRKSVKDDLTKCYVFITVGNRMNKPIKGYLQQSIAEGRQYKYGNSIVFYPSNYPYIFYNGGLKITLSTMGQLIADKPTKQQKELVSTEKSTLMYKAFEANIGNGVVEAIKGKKTPMNIIIIAGIALLVGVVVTFGYMQFQSNQKARIQQPVTQQKQVQPDNSNYQIEVK